MFADKRSDVADEIIDLLLDQPDFECDPITRLDRDTPLHSAIRWLNAEPPAQREFGRALIEMMLEAGSNPRVKNKGGLTPTSSSTPPTPSCGTCTTSAPTSSATPPTP